MTSKSPDSANKLEDNGALHTVIHLVAGGIGGTTGAIITCPLEVVKTRLQSSNSGFDRNKFSSGKSNVAAGTIQKPTFTNQGRQGQKVRSICLPPKLSGNRSVEHFIKQSITTRVVPPTAKSMSVFQCLKHIVKTEGVPGLFKGLGPTLVGVAPSRSIYFMVYSTAKKNLNSTVTVTYRDTPMVHLLSSATAGFCTSTVTNPIWMVRTRLQLDMSSGDKTLTVRSCMRNIHQELGIFGFWKGVTASYWGISETMTYFVLYEHLKKRFTNYRNKNNVEGEKSFLDFFGYMICGAISKSFASVVAYPHEVARTRMREEGHRYKTFWQTLMIVGREEGRVGLYRGLTIQLIRQIPNTAIMMSTYELTVHLLTNYLSSQ